MEYSEIFVLVVLGAAFLHELWAVVLSIKATSWPSVKGQIIDSELDVSHRGGGTVKIKYTYSVEGKDYESSNSVFGAVGYVFWLVRKRYINEDDLVVYHHPTKPQKAVLVTGLRLFFIAEFIPFVFLYYWYLKPVYGV